MFVWWPRHCNVRNRMSLLCRWVLFSSVLVGAGPVCACALVFLLTVAPLLLQFEDSEEDFDSRFDTDDELSYRRDSVYSCVTLPYFHSFLYMKGMDFSRQGPWVWVERWDVEIVFSVRLIEGVGNITLPTPHLVSGSLAAWRMTRWCDVGGTVIPGCSVRTELTDTITRVEGYSWTLWLLLNLECTALHLTPWEPWGHVPFGKYTLLWKVHTSLERTLYSCLIHNPLWPPIQWPKSWETIIVTRFW